jgi:hypothetical protein
LKTIGAWGGNGDRRFAPDEFWRRYDKGAFAK